MSTKQKIWEIVKKMQNHLLNGLANLYIPFPEADDEEDREDYRHHLMVETLILVENLIMTIIGLFWTFGTAYANSIEREYLAFFIGLWNLRE